MGWVIVGTWEDDGVWFCEVLAEGFADEAAAREARSQMVRSLGGDSAVMLDVQTAVWAQRWVTA